MMIRRMKSCVAVSPLVGEAKPWAGFGEMMIRKKGHCCSMFVGRVVGCRNEEGVLKREREKRGVCYPRQVVDGEKAEEREFE